MCSNSFILLQKLITISFDLQILSTLFSNKKKKVRDNFSLRQLEICKICEEVKRTPTGIRLTMLFDHNN